MRARRPAARAGTARPGACGPRRRGGRGCWPSGSARRRGRRPGRRPGRPCRSSALPPRSCRPASARSRRTSGPRAPRSGLRLVLPTRYHGISSLRHRVAVRTAGARMPEPPGSRRTRSSLAGALVMQRDSITRRPICTVAAHDLAVIMRGRRLDGNGLASDCVDLRPHPGRAASLPESDDSGTGPGDAQRLRELAGQPAVAADAGDHADSPGGPGASSSAVS